MKKMFIQFYTTQYCNSKCKHCYLSSFDSCNAKQEDELTYEQVIEAFKILKQLGFEYVAFGRSRTYRKTKL